MKFKHIILFAIFAFFACNQKKQKTISDKTAADSLSYYMNIANKAETNDTKKLEVITKAYKLITPLKNTSKNRDTLFSIAYKYYLMKNWDGFNNTSQLLLKNSISTKDSSNIVKVYRFKANYLKKIEVYDSSFYYYKQAEKIYAIQNDELNLANILFNKGIVQFYASDYLGAELSLTKAYSIFKNSDEKDKLFGTLNQLGLVYNELKEYDKAIFYHNKALEVVQEFHLQSEDHQEAVCYNNLGYLYLRQKKYQKAIENFKLALKDKEIINDDPELYTSLIDNLAYSQLQINDLNNLPNLFYEALSLRKKLDSPTLVVGSYIHLSEYYQYVNDYKKAIQYSNDALRLARESKIPINTILALKQAAIIDIKNASVYSKEYVRISDSLQIAERNSKDRFASLELGTEELKGEKEGLEEKNRNLLYGFAIALLFATLLFAVRYQRTKNRELLYKQAQQKANEEIFNLMMSQQAIIDESRNKEKKRLAQDLHDGILGRMFGLRLNLDSLNSSADSNSIQRRQELLNELKTIEQDIREISHDLNREKQVLINNFVSIVHNLLEEQKAGHESSLFYTIDQSVSWDKIGNAIKINLYRILQESLQNINKYANAKNINVTIASDGEHISLKIKDDGIGFDINKKSKGIGMQNMISRTQDCQGVLDIKSQKNKGTTILISVPIETKQIIVEKE